jgi:hypothetical protein
MTRAASLSAQIARCSAELTGFTSELASQPTADRGNGEWTPREILLHLIGAVRELPDQLRATLAGARELPLRQQQGGAYVDNAAITTASQALDVLVEQLSAVDACVKDLSDDELGMPVQMPVDGVVRGVPIGLLVRHMVADHFDEHIIQLRESMSRAGAPR